MAPGPEQRRSTFGRLVRPGLVLFRPLTALVRFGRRRPGQLLILLLLVSLVGFTAFAAAGQIYGLYHLRAARQALEQYHTRDAQSHLQACLRVRSGDPEVLLLVARTARRAGEYDMAATALEEYEARRGVDDPLTLERMLLRAERGEIEPVRKFFWDRVEKGHPDSPLILEAMARSFTRNFRLREAEEVVERWLQMQPDNTQAHMLRGSISEMRQLRMEAAESYRRVIELDQYHDEARLKLTGVLIELGRGKEALPHLEYLHARMPNESLVDIRLARCKDLMGQQAEAAAILDNLLQRQPDSVDALVERGKLAKQAGQLDEAEALLRRAVALDPGTYGIRFQLYDCLAKEGKTAEADAELAQLKTLEQDMRALEQVLGGEMQRNPHDPALHYKIAMIALRAGQIKEAVRCLQSALREDPNYAPAHQMMSVYYKKTGNLGLAARHQEQARTSSSGETPPSQ